MSLRIFDSFCVISLIKKEGRVPEIFFECKYHFSQFIAMTTHGEVSLKLQKNFFFLVRDKKIY